MIVFITTLVRAGTLEPQLTSFMPVIGQLVSELSSHWSELTPQALSVVYNW